MLIGLLGGVFVVLLLSWIFSPEDSVSKLELPGLIVSAGLSFLVIYFLPRIHRRLPSRILIYTDLIQREKNRELVQFNGVTSFELIEEKSHFVLCLVSKNGDISRYGIPDIETRHKIEVALAAAGLSEISPSDF